MILTVNGEQRDVEEGTTLAQLLQTLKLPETGIAVAINGAVVPRSQHESRSLQSDEAVEVIRAVGGG